MIGGALTLPKKTGVSAVFDATLEDEDSLRTPLNHAGMYGVFLLSELAGQRLDPLTEWALGWISDWAQEHPQAGEGMPDDFVNQVQGSVLDLIKALQERAACLAGVEQASLDGALEGRPGASHVANYDRLEGNDGFGTLDHASAFLGAAAGDPSMARADDDASPSQDLAGRWQAHGVDEESDAGEPTDDDAVDETPQDDEDDALAEEASQDGSDGSLVAGVADDGLAGSTGDSFGFALDAEAFAAGDMTDSDLDIAPMDDAAFAADLEVADVDAVLSSVMPPDATSPGMTVASFISADDFIV